MAIVITQWALDSYLDLKHSQVFTADEYRGTIRPDVLLLDEYPGHPQFQNGKFWSPASDGTRAIPKGFKMKWHQVGPGLVQLRLPVSIIEDAYLCNAYVKADEKKERRMMARFKTYIALIQGGRFIERGRLS